MLKKLIAPFTAFALVVCAAGAMAAEIGEVFLTAYDAAGKKQVEVRGPDKKVKFGKQVTVYTEAQYAKLKKAEQDKNAEKLSKCGTTYRLAKDDLDWIRGHEAAKNQVVVRQRVAKGKIEWVCPKPGDKPGA